ncbi:hypothetical protein HO543_00150 [Streptococcus suis]|nr:hypothetical protein [Streptococcus suis]NQJ75793.1 hypothetical protein [Streptococcus suis]
MAISNFGGVYGRHIQLVTVWRQKSQDITNNRTTGTVTVYLQADQYGYFTTGSGSRTLTVSIDGTNESHVISNITLQNGSKAYLLTKDYTVNHSADGTKSFTLSASFGINVGGYTSATTTETIRPTTIARSSTISFGSGTIGNPLLITVNRQSTNFTHTLRYAWGNKSGIIASNIGVSHTWAIPNDFANDIPNATSGIGTLYVDTYNGSSKIGTQQVNFTASLPASIKPSFTGLTLTDSNLVARSLLSGNNFLQIISNIQVNFNGQTGSYGSTITGYRAEIVNRNQVTTSNGGTLGIMNFNGSATIRASVVDSRGRWSDTKDVTINVIEYFAPILSFTALRTRETPNIIQIIRNAKIAPITLSGSQKNIMTLSFKVAPIGSSSYTADNGSASGSWTTQNTLTNSAANMAGNYPANKSFTIIGTLSDKFTSVEFSTTIATESVVMSYDKDGRVGIGKVAENGPAGSADVAGDIYAGGKLIQHHQLTMNDGRTLRATGDWNNVLSTGYYYGNNLANQPLLSGQNTFKYMKVTRFDNDWILQESIDFGGAVTCYRVKVAGTWKPWKQVVTTDITDEIKNHTNLINTGWQSAGYPGTYYKRVGDILTIKYDFRGNGSTINIGSIPSSIWVAPQSYMLIIAKWSTDGAANSHVQINHGTGALNVLSTGNGIEYRGQLTIMI